MAAAAEISVVSVEVPTAMAGFLLVLRLRQEGIAETSVRIGDDVYRVGVDSTRFAKRGAR